MVAYYSGGAVASFQIRPDGSLSESISYIEHTGSGTHPKRQKKPHAHSIYPNPANSHAYAPDLGADQVFIYSLDADKGSLTSAGYADIPGGSKGPRHMKWDSEGRYAYVLNELDLTLSVFHSAPNGQMKLMKTVSVLPAGTDISGMTSAEIRIHPTGKFIYTSIRDGSEQKRDSMSIFVSYENGLHRLDTVYAEVWFPRNFNIDPSGKWLLVGGQRSRDIAVFSIDPGTGLLEHTGMKTAFEGEPICFEFLRQ